MQCMEECEKKESEEKKVRKEKGREKKNSEMFQVRIQRSVGVLRRLRRKATLTRWVPRQDMEKTRKRVKGTMK